MMKNNDSNMLQWDEFLKVEMHLGTILEVAKFEEARNPSYKLVVDFGPLGQRKTSAQLTKLYNPEDLIGRQVIAVLNFPPKQIANMMSECLILGAVGLENDVVLIGPDRKVENGMRIG